MNTRPQRIGAYRVLDRLGEGGMADVYLAEQTEPVRRRVALKILKAGMDSKQVVARFESERQALAVLDHPNIATVFDGGIADNGRPYFVMELVKGVPITDYCDQHRLDTDERLRLFIDVCAAVQHAHLKGLIHRDLKPSNILVSVVDGKPQPKIIDFGIAKATSITLTESTLYTRVGQIIGTPAYMSPEQAGVTGLDVDTRSDVYSLGVILYELLVGTLPLDLTGISEQAMQIVLRETDPPRPSTRLNQLGDSRDEIARARHTDADELRRQLQGDLDWIVMKAIEKDRTRRYDTVNALAMEGRRFLNHEPIVARPPSAGYLLQRFVRRNRVAVAAATIAVIAVLTGATAATVGMFTAREAQREAEAARDSTNRVLDTMIDLISDTYSTLVQSSQPLRSTQGADVLQNEPLRHILSRTENLVSRTLVDDPGALVRVLRLQGTTNSVLGLYDIAEQRLTRALERARSSNLGQEEIRVLIDLADFKQQSGDIEAAAIYLDQISAVPDFGDASAEVRAEASLVAGAIAVMKDDFSDARTRYSEAIDLLGRSPPDLLLASAYFLMADSWLLQERVAESLPWLEKSISLYVELEGEYYHGLQQPYSAYGWAKHASGDYATGLDYFRRAYDVLLRNFGTEHPLVADELNNIAMALNRMGRYSEAVQHYEQSIDLFKRVRPASDQHRLAGMYSNLGNANANRGEMSLATENYRKGLEVAAQGNPPNQRLLSFLQNNLGSHLFRIGEIDLGIEHLEEAVRIKSEIFGADSVSTARSRLLLAQALARGSRFESAAGQLNQATRVYTSEYSERPHMLALLLETQASLAFEAGRFGEALDLYLEELERHSAAPEGSAAPAEIAETQVNIARVFSRLDDDAQVLYWLKRAEATLESLAPTNHIRIEASLLKLENQANNPIATRKLKALVDREYSARDDWLIRLEELVQ